MRDEGTLIPRRLDTPARILVWDPNQVVLLVTFVFLGIALRNPILWIVIGLAVNFVYGQLFGSKPPGYMARWAYWYLPVRIGFSSMPPSSQREFIG